METEQFKALFIPLGRMMYAEALRILGDPAEAQDVVQDTYVRLWERRGALAEVDNHRAYAMAIVRNRCINLSASPGRRSVGLAEAEETQSILPAEENDLRDRIGKIRGLIDTLPDKQRRVIMMHDVEGCPNSEIEKETGLSSDNVRQLLSRARRFIRDHFSK